MGERASAEAFDLSQSNEATTPRSTGADETALKARLVRLLAASRAAILWERLWPVLAALLGVVAVFLAVSWFGLWLGVPPLVRMAGLVLFAMAALAALWPLLRLAAPARSETLARIDAQATNRPATTAADALALGAADAGSQALWRAHVARTSQAVMRLSLPRPRPGMSRRDPYALRAAAFVAALAGLFAAGPEWRARLDAAFDWRSASDVAASIRVDGWIDPPLYTRLPPIMLDLTLDEAGRPRGAQMRAPVGSTIVVRAAASAGYEAGLKVDAQGGLERPAAAAPDAPAAAPPPGGTQEARLVVRSDGVLEVAAGGQRRAGIAVQAIADTAPVVAFVGEPELDGQQGSARGLIVTYSARDDYGLAALEGRVEPLDPAASGRALIDPPRLPLTAPLDPTSGENASTTLDVGDNPWAGAVVRMTLIARDEAGQEGRSETKQVLLPQRIFTKPLAKALVEQRRDLAMDKGQRRHVQTAIDALRIAPEIFMPNTSEYLGLTIAAERLRNAKTDPDLVEVVEFLWEMALRIEDGDLTEAEQALRAAQEALQQAIDRNASADEIRKLTQDLRRAMDRFLRELAERQRREERDNAQSGQKPENQAQRFLTPQDLNRMLNRMEEAAKQGDMAEAQRLLNELNNILNNLQTARPRQMDPRQQEMGRMLNELDALTRDQQDLRDETFRQENQRRQNRRNQARPGQRGQNQQGQRQQGQRGEQGEGQDGEGQEQAEGQGQGQGESLAQRQQRLRERLEALRRRMEQQGMQPGQGQQGGEGDPLGEAENQMGQAEQGLGKGDGEGAAGAQGRALEAMRRGAQNLAQQMQPGEGEGEDVAGEPNGRPGQQGRASNNGEERDDPLGRPTRNPRANDNARFNRQGGRSGIELRVEEVIRELRRRLGDPSRPQEELDYFERLLRPR